MLIQCTKKLLDVIERKPVAYEEENLLFSWHADLITLNRRKTVRGQRKNTVKNLCTQIAYIRYTLFFYRGCSIFNVNIL